MHKWSSKTDERRLGIHRRGSFYLNDLNNHKSTTRMVTWEVSFPGRHWGAEFQMDYDDEPIHFFFGFIFCLWLSFDTPLMRKLRDRYCPKKPDGKPTYEGREWSIRFHHGSAWWTLGCDPDSWSRSDGWRNSSFNPVDRILGAHTYHEEDLQRYVDVALVMPEGTYQGKVRLLRSTWRRKRRWWPFSKSVLRADVQFENPPMFAGKGENSWDCGDDGIYQMTCAAKTITEALSRYQESVFRNRARYGTASTMVK